jgi:hypothetical protein
MEKLFFKESCYIHKREKNRIENAIQFSNCYTAIEWKFDWIALQFIEWCQRI